MNFTGINLIGVGHLAPDPAWRMNSHLHPYHEFIVLLRGRMRVESEGQELKAAAGDVLFYPARVKHAEWSDETAPVETVFLSFTDDSSQFHRIVRTHDSSGRIRQLARWIHADKQAGTPEIQAEQRLLLQALVAEFRRSLRQPEHPLVRAVRQYIQDHIAEPLSLARLARQTRQSKYHFLRKYKKLAGRTPIQDARGIRINFAKELILSTDLPLKEIAARAGLGNEYTLSRTFRRHFKIPPGELRRTHCLRS